MYRDGSRPMQVLSTGKTGQEDESGAFPELEALKAQLADARAEKHKLEGVLDEVRLQLKEHDREAAASRHKRRRPSMLSGRTMKVESPLGDLYVTINEDDKGKPFEVFCTVGKAGGAAMADSEAIGRLISLSLRSGIPITAVRDQLRGISCDRAVGVGPQKVLSAPDAIAQAIERYLAEKEGVQEMLPIEVPVTVRGGAGVAGQGEYVVDHTAQTLGGLSGLRGGAVGVRGGVQAVLRVWVFGVWVRGGWRMIGKVAGDRDELLSLRGRDPVPVAILSWRQRNGCASPDSSLSPWLGN